MSIILSIVALLLFVLVGVLSIITFLFTDVKNRKWYQLIDKKAFQMAFNIDVFGNYLFKDFWNLTMSSGGYAFGVFGETISSALGKKQLEKTLSHFGFIVLIILNVIDVTKWFKKGHCIASIQTDEQIKNFIKK